MSETRGGVRGCSDRRPLLALDRLSVGGLNGQSQATDQSGISTSINPVNLVVRVADREDYAEVLAYRGSGISDRNETAELRYQVR